MSKQDDAMAEQTQTNGKLAGSGQLRPSLDARFGQLVRAVARHQRYQGLPLADLAPLLLAPLRAECVASGELTGDNGGSGIAIWCSVSPEVSARIAQQADRGVFPIRLAKDEWRSGDDVWLLDVLAPTQAVGTAVFAGFSKQIDRSFRMHPVVARSLDPALVKQIGTAVAKAGDAPAA